MKIIPPTRGIHGIKKVVTNSINEYELMKLVLHKQAEFLYNVKLREW